MKPRKTKLLALMLILALLISVTPLLPAAAETYTATLLGQLDIAVSEGIDEWGLGDLPEATVEFELGEPSTISMSFDEPIKFTGNWTGISTDVPVSGDEGAQAVGGYIISFVVDGVDLGSKEVPLIDRDDAGNLCIDIARKWGGDYDAYDLAGMDPFSTLEITFIVGVSLTYEATLLGQLDVAVSESVEEWGIGDLPEATVTFELGKPATISLSFDEPIKFTGNWTGISTTVPVSGDEEAVEIGGKILAFVVDGVDLGEKEVPLIDRDGAGNLCLDIARKWGGDYDDYDLAGMAPFSTLEITFIVGDGSGTAPPPQPEKPPVPDFNAAGSYKAYLGLQTNHYTFRNEWNEEWYGLDGFGWADTAIGVNNFNGLTGWAVGGDALKMPGVFTDVEIKGNGTYRVSLNDWDFNASGDGTKTDGEAASFNMLFVSTDIPYDDAITVSDVKVVLGGNTRHTFKEGIIEDGDYIRIGAVNTYNDDLKDIFNDSIPASGEIAVEFTISGFSYDNDAGANTPDPAPAGVSPAPSSPGDDGEGGGNGLVIGLIIGGVVVLGAIAVVVMKKGKK